MNYPVTPAIRFLRERKIDFTPHVYEYVEKGGTKHSAEVLGVDEHAVIKTLVFETNEKKSLIVLMHGDFQVSTKILAHILNVKTIAPASAERAKAVDSFAARRFSGFDQRTGEISER